MKEILNLAQQITEKNSNILWVEKKHQKESPYFKVSNYLLDGLLNQLPEEVFNEKFNLFKGQAFGKDFALIRLVYQEKTFENDVKKSMDLIKPFLKSEDEQISWLSEIEKPSKVPLLKNIHS